MILDIVSELPVFLHAKSQDTGLGINLIPVSGLLHKLQQSLSISRSDYTCIHDKSSIILSINSICPLSVESSFLTTFSAIVTESNATSLRTSLRAASFSS